MREICNNYFDDESDNKYFEKDKLQFLKKI